MPKRPWGCTPATKRHGGTDTNALPRGWRVLLLGDLQEADLAFEEVISAEDYTPISRYRSVRAVYFEAGRWPMGAGPEDFAERAGSVGRQPGIEESYCTPLVCAVQARAAWHRGEAQAAGKELTGAQRTRHLLTYALPHLAVQARVELGWVYLAVGDAAGAATLLREVDDILRRRPRLGTLVGEVEALRSRISGEHELGILGASALTAG